MRRALRLIAIVAGIAIVAAFLFAWSGIYNIAASRGHWLISRLAIQFAMQSSVRTHAMGIDVPPLDDAALVERGAAHFQGSCALCHGAPGVERNPVARRLIPEPPPLDRKVRDWKTRELFWIVKHGIKYTGMPAWVALERDDEVWAVVAFLEEMPGMSGETYRRLAFGELADAGTTRRELLEGERTGEHVSACARCHGFDGRGRESGAFPDIAGQPAPYLLRALREYASGIRPSGIMQPVAAELSDAEMRRLADHYARQRPRGGADLRGEDVAAGRAIAAHGVPGRGIPACNDCHGSRAAADYPRLAGQYAQHTIQQIMLWRQDARGRGTYAEIMAPIAERLTDAEIRAVAAYYASVNRDGDAP